MRLLPLLVFAAVVGISAAYDDPVPTGEQLRNIILERADKLYRFADTERWIYRYDFERSRICGTAGHVQQRSVGYVLRDQLYHMRIKEHCPSLVKMSVWRAGDPRWTFIGNYNPHPETAYNVGYFYCSPSPNYCGANQPIYQVNVAPGNMLYTDYKTEADCYGKPVPIPCYIWKPQASRARGQNSSIVKEHLIKADSYIYRTVTTLPSQPRVTRITTSYRELTQKLIPISAPHTVPQGTVARIVKPCDAPDILKLCPELIKMNVFQLEGGNKLTRIIDASLPAPNALYCDSPSFYCSPRRGYCGADQPIYAVPSNPPGVDFLYPSNDMEFDVVTCQDQGHQNDFYRFCYGWE